MGTINKEAIKQKIKKRIATIIKEEPETIADDSKFSDIGVDSADMINIIYDLESDFNIVISDEEMDEISTIQEACNLINDKINNRDYSP